MSAGHARSEHRAVLSSRAGAGRKKLRCACSTTTSTPRSPSAPTISSSTAAPARPRARGRRSTPSCASCATLEDDETLLVQSGKPVGVFRTHDWAPRVLIANSNLVPDWATWDEFRRLEHLGLTMYGQMTAGSWIYIGTQGILQGTYETFAAIARRRFGGTLARHDHAHRGPRRHGRRAAARGDDERWRGVCASTSTVTASHAASRRATSTR